MKTRITISCLTSLFNKFLGHYSILRFTFAGKTNSAKGNDYFFKLLNACCRNILCQSCSHVAWVSKREERDANSASSTRKHLGYSKPMFLQCFPNVSLYAFPCNICRGHKTCVLKAFGLHNVIFAAMSPRLRWP